MAGGRVTQRDLVDTISELRAISVSLTKLAGQETPDGAPSGTVLAYSRGLDRYARFLEVVADELKLLIPDVPVKVPP